MAEGLNGRETLLVFLAAGITLLLSMSVSELYGRRYWHAIECFAIAGALTYVFFRHRKVILTITGLAFLIVNVGLTNIFHPSVSGYLVTYGSAVGLVLLIWWRVRRRAQMGKMPGGRGMHALFDKDHGDEL